MRCMMIVPQFQKVFELREPVQIDYDFICSVMDAEEAFPVRVADDVDMWMRAHQVGRPFTIEGIPVEVRGRALLCGRSKLGDCKGLPMHVSLEWIAPRISFPDPLEFLRAA